MISDESIVRMADQLGQTLAYLKQVGNVIEQIINRLEKLEKEVEEIHPTLN